MCHQSCHLLLSSRSCFPWCLDAPLFHTVHLKTKQKKRPCPSLSPPLLPLGNLIPIDQDKFQSLQVYTDWFLVLLSSSEEVLWRNDAWKRKNLFPNSIKWRSSPLKVYFFTQSELNETSLTGYDTMLFAAHLVKLIIASQLIVSSTEAASIPD